MRSDFAALCRVLILTFAALCLAACAEFRPKGAQRSIREPRTFGTLSELLPQVNSVISGRVDGIRFDYDDCDGPRTVVQLTGVKTLLGDQRSEQLELRTFGGPLPDGEYVYASELPRFVLNAEYVVFLRNTDWRFSPVIGDWALRKYTIFGKEVLVNTDGFAATGINEQGLRFSAKQVAEPVGLRAVGLSISPEQRSRMLDAAPTVGGEVAICATASDCRSSLRADASKALDNVKVSRRFAAPALRDDVSPESVKGAISSDELVSSVKRFAVAHSLRLGGYFAERARIGCWDTTQTQRPRR